MHILLYYGFNVQVVGYKKSYCKGCLFHLIEEFGHFTMDNLIVVPYDFLLDSLLIQHG